MIDTADAGQSLPILRRISMQRLVLGLVLVWLGIAGGALWLHRSPPVADVIVTPLPGWQVQVWFGTRTIIAHSAGELGRPVVPIIVVFYETPYTGIRFLGRLTLPAWPLAISAGTLVALAVLVLTRPWFAHRRVRRQ